MLHLAKRVIGSTVQGSQGDIGILRDFYYSQHDWVVRSLLIEAGDWLDGQHVVVPAHAVKGNWGREGILVGLSSQTVAKGRVYPSSETAAGAEMDLAGNSMLSLRSGVGLHLHAVDGEVGHVDDFLIEESTWRIPYLLVDTSNWIGGRAVIVRTDVVRRADIRDALPLTATREQVRNSPTFDTISGLVNAAEVSAPFTFI